MKSFLNQIDLVNFIALDLETTGLDSERDKIIEISAYRFSNGRPVGSFTSLINPEIKINNINQYGLIHLAWSCIHDYNNSQHFENILNANYIFIKNLINKNIKKILVSGTCFEYGLKEGSIGPETQPNPVTAYGYGKYCLSKNLEFLRKENNFIFQWARIFYLYGPLQNKKSLISQLIKLSPIFV